MTISFKITNQSMSPMNVDSKPKEVVSDSLGYLYAKFSFTSDWDNLVKSAIFVTEQGVSKIVPLDDANTCLVPHEVIKPDYFFVSAYGVNTIGDLVEVPTTVSKVIVLPSGLKDGTEPDPPSQDTYDIIIAIMQKQAVDATRAEAAAASAADSKDAAQLILDDIGDIGDAKVQQIIETGDQQVERVSELIDDKANKSETHVENNIFVSDANGDLKDSGYPMRILDGTIKRYGVSGVGGSNPSLTRLWDSINLTAAAGTDTLAPTNDFDNIAPFNRRKCVGRWTFSIPEASPVLKFIVNAYHGDPDYAEDGSMGDYVAVEVDPLYYYQDDFSQFNVEQIQGVIGVSPTQFPGWKAHPVCTDINNNVRQKTYLPCYALASKDGKGVSLPGLQNAYGAYKTLFDIARTYADTTAAPFAMLEPMYVRHYEWLLFTIEYATTHCQSIMQGASSLAYSDSDTYQSTVATTGELDNNKFILVNSAANNFVVGQVVAFASTAYADSYRRNVIGIEVYDESNKALVFDGEPLNIPVGYWVSSRPYRTGACNSVLTPSGSPVSNTNAKYPMRYRWRENIWGNQYSTCHDLMGRRIGEGTEESPYMMEWYYLINPSYYPSSTSKPDELDLLSSSWVKLEQTTPYLDGYIKQIAMDKKYPHVIIPVLIGGSSVTYYSDHAYLVSTAGVIRAVRLGGYVFHGAYYGVLHFNANYAPSNAAWSSGGGLYFRQ